MPRSLLLSQNHHDRESTRAELESDDWDVEDALTVYETRWRMWREAVDFVGVIAR